MSLTLRYHAKTSVPVEIEGVVPDRLRDKSLAEIERLAIFHGNRKLALAELFSVSGDPADGRIDLEGDLAGVHFIGYGMKRGEIHVHGNAGRHVGGEMTGGRIKVDGNAGDWVGGEMHGGLIHVAGNAGHLDRRGLSRQQEGDDRRHDPDRRRRRAARPAPRCGAARWSWGARAATPSVST